MDIQTSSQSLHEISELFKLCNESSVKAQNALSMPLTSAAIRMVDEGGNEWGAPFFESNSTVHPLLATSSTTLSGMEDVGIKCDAPIAKKHFGGDSC